MELSEYFNDLENSLTRFGLTSQLGFPKYYDDKKLISLLKKFYSSNFDSIEFVVLYGSQKPKSDIDLFIVSNNKSHNFFNGWLDIFELNTTQFKEYVSNLAISVTDPLFSGKLICGDEQKYSKIKEQILNKPLYKEMIEFNIQRLKQKKAYLPHFKLNDKQRIDCLNYIRSYELNSKLLSQGTNFKKIKFTTQFCLIFIL